MAKPRGPRACARCGESRLWRSGSETVCDSCCLADLKERGVAASAIVMRGSKKGAVAACAECGCERFVEVAALRRGRALRCRTCVSRDRSYGVRACPVCGVGYTPRSSNPGVCDACEEGRARDAGYDVITAARRGPRRGVLARCESCGLEHFVPSYAVARGESHRCLRCSRVAVSRQCTRCNADFASASTRAPVCDECLLAIARDAGYEPASVARRDGRIGVLAACAQCGTHRFVALHQVRVGAARYCRACRGIGIALRH